MLIYIYNVLPKAALSYIVWIKCIIKTNHLFGKYYKTSFELDYFWKYGYMLHEAYQVWNYVLDETPTQSSYNPDVLFKAGSLYQYCLLVLRHKKNPCYTFLTSTLTIGWLINYCFIVANVHSFINAEYKEFK